MMPSPPEMVPEESPAENPCMSNPLIRLSRHRERDRKNEEDYSHYQERFFHAFPPCHRRFPLSELGALEV
jgi:hypothetical protein